MIRTIREWLAYGQAFVGIAAMAMGKYELAIGIELIALFWALMLVYDKHQADK